jgi:hypothetical protein
MVVLAVRTVHNCPVSDMNGLLEQEFPVLDMCDRWPLYKGADLKLCPKCLQVEYRTRSLNVYDISRPVLTLTDKDMRVYALLMLNVESQYHVVIQRVGTGEVALSAIVKMF